MGEKQISQTGKRLTLLTLLTDKKDAVESKFVNSFIRSIRGWEEPNDHDGNDELCTFVVPETEGNNGPLSRFGPMWGDIDCGAKSFNWPKSHSRVVMVPICEGKSMKTT